MSMPKCPVCNSTDVNSITCNKCGAMLLYMGNEKKDVDSLPKKENQSTETILKEILESANVKHSAFDKIEYIDDGINESEGLESIVTDKSFADLALEMGFDKKSSTSDDATDIPDTMENTLINKENAEDIVTVYNHADEEEKNSEAEDISLGASDSEIADPENERMSMVERISQRVNEKIENEELLMDNPESISYDEELTPAPKLNYSDKVEKISQKINEKIENEAGSVQESEPSFSDNDLLSAPVWQNSDKIIKKDKNAKYSKEDKGMRAGLMDTDTTFNKTLNMCRFLLMILMLITVVCMFLPSTRLGGFSSGQSVQIFAVISVIPFAVGFILCIKEKQYIRKFIYSLIVSLLFAFVYSVFMLSFSSSGFKGIVYLLLCALIAIVSLIGIRADKSSSVRKINTWFDAFTYIQFFVNVLVILFVILVAILVPDMVEGPEISLYLFELCMVMALCAVSAILMLKRFSFGADLIMISSIAFIVANIISYNKIMAAVSFDYTVNIPYMSYMGMAVSLLNVFCTLFAAGMFFWMKYLQKITPEKL
ncbi:MAG: DMT family transporter [Ruminococcaceae bacterium]|nr:DMT family transporter [Oscillospiraceae bacterium]